VVTATCQRVFFQTADYMPQQRLKNPYISISIAQQLLELRHGQSLLKSFRISTAKNGPGEKFGSECTPRGRHRIRAKIGAGLPLMSVFVGRRPTGEIYSPETSLKYPNRDWILTRILWLGGMEAGKNRFGNVDTAKRYIYIHGSPETQVTGVPNSHGCIRMKNTDILDLFDHVDTSTYVLIAP